MGLITCTRCKKVYEYEKNSGICPKCARYNRENTAAQEHQEYHDKYDGGYRHTAQDGHHSYHQKYDTDRNPHRHQLEGLQGNLKELMGAGQKQNAAPKTQEKNKMNRRTKLILIVFAIIFGLNFILPLLGVFFSWFLFW